MRTRIVILTLLALLFTVLLTCRPTKTGDVVFSNVNVIDVVNGVVIEAQDVVIQGNTLKEILDHGSAGLETQPSGSGPYSQANGCKNHI